MALLAFLLAAPAAAAPALSWVSQPVLPGETVVLQGAGFGNGSTALLRQLGGRGKALELAPAQVSEDGAVLKFVLPATEPLAAYEVAVRDEHGAACKPWRLNVPDIHWAHGDQHETATPGGFVRIFGKALFFPEAQAAARAALELAQGRLRAAVAGADEGAVHAAAAALEESQAMLRGMALPTLRLMPVQGQALLLHAENATGYAAFFKLPAGMRAGAYKVSVASNIAPEEFSEMRSFHSAVQPAVSSVEVRAAVPWPERRFVVTDYDQNIGKVPLTGDKAWNDSSPALQRALEDAGRAGGGVVYFPRGQYYLGNASGFTVPWNVRILGESREAVALYLLEANRSNAPQAFFRAPGTLSIDPEPWKAGTGRWGVEGVTVYVTGFHNYIFLLNNRTTGWHMHRCRLQVNAYLGSNGPYTKRDPLSWKNFTIYQVAALVGLNNCRNWQITQNHLYATSDVVNSYIHHPVCSSKDMSGCHGAAWGWIADNDMYNGGASHFMNQWNQIIFERNRISGVSVVAGGQSVGTGPGGGFAQNIYHGENSIRYVHFGDREIITFDNAGGAYFGTVAKVQGAEVTFAFDAKSAQTPEWGGWGGACVVVLNGTGVGQWRRVVKPGIDIEPFNAKNRTWLLDRPFAIDPSRDSVVQVVPFRGRIIFHRDSFVDGGTVQFFGQAMDVVVAASSAERMSGFVSWGQWRGCWEYAYCRGIYPPYRTTGEMGNGIMPNAQIQFIGNTVLEGNKVDRWTARGRGADTGYQAGNSKFLNGASFAIMGAGNCLDSIFMSMNVLFRRNRVLSNGGFNIGDVSAKGIRDVLVEGNVVEESDPESALSVGKNVRGLLVRENSFPNGTRAVLVL